MKPPIIIALLLLALAFAQPARAGDEWRIDDSWRESGYLVLLAIDWRQTRRFTQEGGAERNQILGEHPSPGRVDAVFAIAALGHVAISYALPRRFWRDNWQVVTIIGQGASVLRNVQMNVRIEW